MSTFLEYIAMDLVACTLLVVLCLAAAVEGRIGESSGLRRLQHRKLQWAAEEVAIPDQYIVVFRDDMLSTTEAHIVAMDWMTSARSETKVLYEYGSAVSGVVFSRLPTNTLEQILDDPRVAYIQQVSHARISYC